MVGEPWPPIGLAEHQVVILPRAYPLAAQAEVLADLRAVRTRLEQFRRINGRGPRTLAEHNLVLDGPPDA